MLRRTGKWWGAGAVSLAMLAAGCGSPPAGAPAAGAKVPVVASTNVYGDIAGRIGGDRVAVTSIIASPDADPHAYEAGTRTRLDLARARVVIENGGGYDDFVGAVLRSAGGAPTVLDVVEISGRTAAAGAELNEHVWYDLPTVRRLAGRLADALGAADPAGAATYTANAAAFQREVERLEARAAAIRAAHAGAGAVVTEPVPLYLLEACGLVDRTPAGFSQAIEEGGGVPADVLRDTLDLLARQGVALLAYNEQTTGPETRKVLAAARAAGVAVVPVTETLPAGRDYLAWMDANLSAIEAALR